MIDAPIIDDFDESDPSRGSKRSGWGFDRIKRSVARNVYENDKLTTKKGNVTLEKGNEILRRRSWKDLSRIKSSLNDIARILKAEHSANKKDDKLNKTSYAERRRWFSKIQYQNKLMTRLSSIDKNLKKSTSGGGWLGSIGTLGKLFANKSGGLISTLIGGGKGGGITNALLGALLGGKIAKTVGKGALGALSFGRKALGHVGTFLKAGKARLASPLLSRGLVGGLGSVVGKVDMAGLTRLAGILLPRIVARILTGVPGAVAMVAKLVWDNILPDKWKSYITYKVAKLYLKAIDKVSDLFMWIAEKFDSMKKSISEMIDRVVNNILKTLSFIGDLITGEGDARSRVSNYFSTLYNSIENTVGNYIRNFVSMFKQAYDSFMKPFYDDKGNFSIMKGITYYAKTSYDVGVKAYTDARDQVTTFATNLWEKYNPMNLQKHAENYVKVYEKGQAEQAKRDALLQKTQDQNNKLLSNLANGIGNFSSMVMSGAGTAFDAVGSGLGMIGGGIIGTAQASGFGTGGTWQAGGEGNTSGLSGLIAKAESGGAGYNAYNRGNAGDSKTPINLQAMTVGQIMQLQAQKKLFAVGKYQMVPDTLRAAVNALRVNPNAKFDSNMQEYLFKNYLITNKRPNVAKYITGQNNDLQGAQVALAQEFASIGMPYTGAMKIGDKHYSFQKDGTFYAGKGGNNRASVSSGQTAAQLNASRIAYQRAIQEGKSPSEAWQIAVGASSTGVATMDPSNGYSAMTMGDGTGQPTDMWTRFFQALKNPQIAKQMYEESKAGAVQDAKNRAIAKADTTNLSYPDVIKQFEEIDAPVNGMKQLISRNPVFHNGVNGKDVKENLTDGITSNTSPNNVSKITGSSPSDFFSRPNIANVKHENAFPS